MCAVCRVPSPVTSTSNEVPIKQTKKSPWDGQTERKRAAKHRVPMQQTHTYTRRDHVYGCVCIYKISIANKLSLNNNVSNETTTKNGICFR